MKENKENNRKPFLPILLIFFFVAVGIILRIKYYFYTSHDISVFVTFLEQHVGYYYYLFKANQPISLIHNFFSYSSTGRALFLFDFLMYLVGYLCNFKISGYIYSHIVLYIIMSLVVFKYTRDIYDSKTALIALVLITFSWFHIINTFPFFCYQFIATVTITTMYFHFQALSKDSFKYWSLLFIFLLINNYIHAFSAILFGAVSFYFLIIVVRKKLGPRKNVLFRYLFLLVLISILSIPTWLIFKKDGVIVLAGYRREFYPFTEGLKTWFNPKLFTSIDSYWSLAYVLFFFVGMIESIIKAKKFCYFLLPFSYFIFFISFNVVTMSIFAVHDLRDDYWLPFFPIFIIYVARGISLLSFRRIFLTFLGLFLIVALNLLEMHKSTGEVSKEVTSLVDEVNDYPVHEKILFILPYPLLFVKNCNFAMIPLDFQFNLKHETAGHLFIHNNKYFYISHLKFFLMLESTEEVIKKCQKERYYLQRLAPFISDFDRVVLLKIKEIRGGLIWEGEDIFLQGKDKQEIINSIWQKQRRLVIY